MLQLAWLSFDLGIDGDYSSLYYWLDAKNAKECGMNVASFYYSYETDLFKEIQKELKKAIRLRKTDRIYIVYGYYEGEKKKYRGKFIVGSRKPSPWEGFSSEELDDGEDNEY